MIHRFFCMRRSPQEIARHVVPSTLEVLFLLNTGVVSRQRRKCRTQPPSTTHSPAHELFVVALVAMFRPPKPIPQGVCVYAAGVDSLHEREQRTLTSTRHVSVSDPKQGTVLTMVVVPSVLRLVTFRKNVLAAPDGYIQKSKQATRTAIGYSNRRVLVVYTSQRVVTFCETHTLLRKVSTV